VTEIVSFSRNPSKQIPFTALLLLFYQHSQMQEDAGCRQCRDEVEDDIRMKAFERAL
jgi:hypothetical protein